MPMFRMQFLMLLMMSFSIASTHAQDKVTLFAAASLTNAISQIASLYTEQHGTIIQKSFGSSATLAKQIEHGAPADIFISADTRWMEYLLDKQALDQGSVSPLLNNTLVMITPKAKPFNVALEPHFKFSQAFTGKLCTGEPSAVPAGIYAKQALTRLQWWDDIQARVVGAQDVRAALTLVERGECEVGIVYQTDAQISDNVLVIATFPPELHAPILYPISLTRNAQPSARKVYEFLKSSAAAKVFKQHGFKMVTP